MPICTSCRPYAIGMPDAAALAMKNAIFVLGAWALLSACAASAQSVARARATNDLACPEASIVVREAVSGTVETIGCGRRATYTCPRSDAHRVCILEGATGPVEEPVRTTAGASSRQ
jgi:hypothetical protein